MFVGVEIFDSRFDSNADGRFAGPKCDGRTDRHTNGRRDLCRQKILARCGFSIISLIQSMFSLALASRSVSLRPCSFLALLNSSLLSKSFLHRYNSNDSLQSHLRLVHTWSILSPATKCTGDKIDRAVDFVASVYGAGAKSQVHEY